MQTALLESMIASLDPPEQLTPSDFAERYRVLHQVYCSERAGEWRNDVFPYQAPVMNVVQEAVQTGRRGVVFMKAGQIGGTDCMINAALWLKRYFPGPQLFMTSTEKVAAEFGRERFELIIRDMEPLRGVYTPNPRGDILTKRFSDGKIQLSGGQSVFNLQSTPYRVVVIDELDSLVENLGGEGDPVKLAEVRTDSFTGQTLMLAYAHPTEKDRGAARMYLDSSDQRRGFVKHSCGAEFYLQWEHVKSTGDTSDPSMYVYACPQCSAAISDPERIAMVRKVTYRSVLPEAEARKKSWIGVHASQLYSPNKSLRSLAERWLECGDDENQKRVFFNKVLGEPYEPKIQKIDLESLRSLVVRRDANNPDAYRRGQVPAEVRFLTAGQDSRSVELHHAVWGWGVRRLADQTLTLCGWLIDWGIVKRAHSHIFTETEYHHAFDDAIYRRRFPSVDGKRELQVLQCGHDVGWEPTQIPIIRFCRCWPQRAVPVRGAAVNATSSTKAPYVRWGSPLKFRAGANTIADQSTALLLMNTFMLKSDWYGWVDQRIKIPTPSGPRETTRIMFPEDVDDEYLIQSQAEHMVKGKEGELIWRKTGPNHFADCNTYALGCAYNLDPFQQNQTVEEYRERRAVIRPAPPMQPSRDYAMG